MESPTPTENNECYTEHSYLNFNTDNQQDEQTEGCDFKNSETADTGDTVQPSSVIEGAREIDLNDSLSMVEAFTNSLQLPLPKNINKENLTQSAEQLIEDINAKRKQDSQLIADFKTAISLQIDSTVNMLQQSIFHLYEKQGKVIQEKIQELFACLDRITKLEEELKEFRGALQMLYQEMH